MPPPSESNPPDFDEVRRRADEFARHAYPDVVARFERIHGGLEVNAPMDLATVDRLLTTTRTVRKRLETKCGLLSSLKRHLRIRMAELCYDTQHVEAVTFPVDVPDKNPSRLVVRLYQEELPYKPLLGRFMRNIFPL